MPCKCDHMEPHAREIAVSRVLTIRHEIMTGRQHPEWRAHWRGSHPLAGGVSQSQQAADLLTAGLCETLRGLGEDKIKKLSLEAQMWWRDHQEADIKREKLLELCQSTLPKFKWKAIATTQASALRGGLVVTCADEGFRVMYKDTVGKGSTLDEALADVRAKLAGAVGEITP